jgi:hypothetical protein
MRAGRTRLAGCAALLIVVVGMYKPASVLSADSNSLPPDLELTASSADGAPLGRNAGSLASYSTGEADSSWEYANDSDVTFSCRVDGKPVSCSRTYREPCCSVVVPLRAAPACPRRPGSALRQRLPACQGSEPQPTEPTVPEGKVLGLGPETGWVPIPRGLSDGPHEVTVIAADEDGVDPDPPTVIALYDIKRPDRPRLLVKPRRVSHNPKPIFRFTGSDPRGLFDGYNDPFTASLKRIRPPGQRIYNGNPFGSYLEWRGPFCRTRLRCKETAWAAYSAAGEGGTSFGIRERLAPGLYEFRVRATDAAENKSRYTRYRFRVLATRRR